MRRGDEYVTRSIRRKRSRRRRHRRYRQMDWGTFAITVAFYIIALMVLFTIIISIHFSYKNYQIIKQQVVLYEEKIEEYANEISIAQADDYYLAGSLYEVTKNSCMDSGDEVVERLFQEKFPDDDAFYSNQDNGLIVIYALFENHPEIKLSTEVLHVIQNIEWTRTEYENAIDSYNMIVEFYNNWVRQWNDSWFCRIFGGGKIEENQYRMILIK